jgi:anti-sigma factor RsiW
MSTISPTEQDLHAYLDGELPPERYAAVEEYLGHNPGEAQRLKAYRGDGEAIAKLFMHADQIVLRRAHPSLVTSIPTPAARRAIFPGAESLRAKSWRAKSLRAKSWRAWSPRTWQLAAAVTLFVFAASWGLLRQGNFDASELKFGTDAATAHLLATGPAPTTHASLDEISTFLSAGVNGHIELRKPDGDYQLVDSRFVTTPRGRAGQLAFRGPDQSIITMYLEPRRGSKDTPFQPVATGHGELTTLVWTDDEIACAVTGALPPERLEQLARSLYEAVFS